MDGEIITREAPIQRLPKTCKQFSDDFYAILYPSDEQAANAVSLAEKKAQRQAALARYVDLQIQEKDRFNHIFKTEKGSVYFIFDTGESVRVKRDEGEWKIQPRCKKIVYVDEEQCVQLLQCCVVQTQIPQL